VKTESLSNQISRRKHHGSGLKATFGTSVLPGLRTAVRKDDSPGGPLDAVRAVGYKPLPEGRVLTVRGKIAELVLSRMWRGQSFYTAFEQPQKKAWKANTTSLLNG
jgi:hypothetical protein